MDYIRKYIPQWTWEPINICRLYFKTVTLSNITSYGGQWIPGTIFSVKEPLQNSRLQFPRQCKPNISDVKYWQYFVKMITNKQRKLNQSLGRRYPNPHQQFPSIEILESGDFLRFNEGRWSIYGLLPTTRKINLRKVEITYKLPQIWCSMHAIRTTEWLISLPRKCTFTPCRATPRAVLGKFT